MSKPASEAKAPVVKITRPQAKAEPAPSAAPASSTSSTSSTAPMAAGEDRLRSAALALLQLQGQMRKTRTIEELAYFLANEPRHILRAQQIIVFERSRPAAYRVRAISSLTSIERSSPMVLWLESIVDELSRNAGFAEPREFDSAAFRGRFEAIEASYPLRNMLWVPWIGADDTVIGGMLLTRSMPWTEQDNKIALHLAGAFAHAWSALYRRSVYDRMAPLASRRNAALAALLAAMILALPVSMSALAPVEVAPREPMVVTPAVEGVVRSVEVQPNEPVRAGQVLVTLADTVLKNRLEIAERKVQVAETKLKKAGQLAFVDARGRHDLAIAQAELELERAERDYARDLLARTEIRADRDGIAFFADRKDLVGRPVVAGEKLMQVARPDVVEFHIDLPVADAIVLREGARVKVFLDSDPLRPIDATLKLAAYKATVRETRQLAFRLVAQASDAAVGGLRLGVRGTAQVYSDKVPLAFYLFRRPIAALRQWVGL